MLAAERNQKIKHLLTEYKKVDVTSLSKLLSVSEVTIRKDFERLENESFLTRTHGGAILCENVQNDNIYNHFDIPELEHKKRIGLIAASMVSNNEAIFLGAGTTCMQIAKNLKDKKNVTVVTNNINSAMELCNVPGIKVVILGGELKSDEYTHSVFGPSAVKALKEIYVDKAFVNVSGISFKRGYTMQDHNDAIIAEEIYKFANEFIIVADSTKFNKIAFSQFGDLLKAKKIISDEAVPEEYLKYYFENSIQIFTTYKLD